MSKVDLGGCPEASRAQWCQGVWAIAYLSDRQVRRLDRGSGQGLDWGPVRMILIPRPVADQSPGPANFSPPNFTLG